MVRAFMVSAFGGQFLSKWFGHNTFALVVKIRENAFHREIESPIATSSQY
jgi:hypothetical protein